MSSIIDFKVQLVQLIRDPNQWAAFSKSPQDAVKIAASWGITMTSDQAKLLIFGLGEFLQKRSEADLEFLNMVIRQEMLVSEPGHFGIADSGRLNNGPHYPVVINSARFEFPVIVPQYLMVALADTGVQILNGSGLSLNEPK